MAIDLPALPYAPDALEPQLSATALKYHHQHHLALVEALNSQVADTGFQAMPLPGIIRQARGPLHSTAAEVWNHQFFWHSLRPAPRSASEANPNTGSVTGPEAGALATAIDDAFGSFDGLRDQFNALALSLPGSGWVWLVQRRHGSLALAATVNAGNPLTGTDTPLLACDIWEHAYLIDHPGRLDAWLDAFWQLVDWPTVAARLA